MLTWIESHGGFTSVHKGLMTSRAWHLTRNGQLNQFPIHMPNFPLISWSIFEWQRILLWVAIIRDSDHHFQKGKQWGRRMQSKQHGKKRSWDQLLQLILEKVNGFGYQLFFTGSKSLAIPSCESKSVLSLIPSAAAKVPFVLSDKAMPRANWTKVK